MSGEAPRAAGQGEALRHAALQADLPAVIRSISTITRHDVAEGVRTASQRLLVEVLLRSDNVALREYRVPALRDDEIAGNCAALWPLKAPRPALARDTGRGWRMDGALPPVCNLHRNWFLLCVPVLFEGARDHSLVLIDAEADGLHRRNAPLAGLEGIDRASVKLNRVFLREDEIVSSEATAFVHRLTPFALGLRCAVLAGACLGFLDKWFESQERERHLAAIEALVQRAGAALGDGSTAPDMVSLLATLQRQVNTLAWWPPEQSSMVAAQDRARLVRLTTL